MNVAPVSDGEEDVDGAEESDVVEEWVGGESDSDCTVCDSSSDTVTEELCEVVEVRDVVKVLSSVSVPYEKDIVGVNVGGGVMVGVTECVTSFESVLPVAEKGTVTLHEYDTDEVPLRS